MSPTIEQSIEQIDFEINQINTLYPNIHFSISIPLNEFDDIIGEDKMHIQYECLIFEPHNYSNYMEVIDHMEFKKEGPITKRDVFNHMRDIDYRPRDNHIFIEEFQKIKDNHYSFILGS